MTFPANNLPTASRTWAREVEKKVTNLEGSFRSAEVNNVTRDSQLSVTANAALNAATQAQSAATDAAAAAAQAQTAANTANAAIAGLGSLDEETSTYKINAANLTVGTLSGNRISGGEIVGTTLKTAGNGRRVEIQSTNTAYFDENGNFTGRIIGAGTDRGATVEILGPGSGMIGVWNEGAYIESSGGREVVFGGAGMSLFNSPLSLDSASPITINGANINVQSASVITNGITMGPSNLTASGTITANSGLAGSSVSVSGSISGTSISGSSVSNSGTYTGNGFPTIRDNTVSGTSFPANVFIASGGNGNMARKTDASERRLKENIQEFEFDTDAFINVSPVTFNYKREAVSDDEQASRKNLGFILDDFEDAGVGEFLIFQAEGDDFKQLRYDLLAIYLHKVVQEQATTIKDLTTRLEALESR